MSVVELLIWTLLGLGGALAGVIIVGCLAAVFSGINALDDWQERDPPDWGPR